MARTRLIDLLTQDALPLETIVLGRLVTNTQEPWQDFCNFSLKVPAPENVSDAIFENVEDTSTSMNSTGITAKLTELLHFIFNRVKDSKSKLNTKHAIVRRLLNPSEFLEVICAEEKVRRWIEAIYKKPSNEIYMVVGLIIVTDAQIGEAKKHKSDIDTALTVPITAAITAGVGAALPPGSSVADPKVAVDAKRMATTNISIDAPGDRIIAVQYRRLTRDTRSSKEQENLEVFLERSTRWMPPSVRGTTEGDILEVGIDEDNSTFLGDTIT
ncbi:hypothetical protein IFM51744_10809 [Aspergillus udagawae]|nr:hypothetical protein IFM51744_10809 [Aspergillus udagawae]